jgi:hypothetical protein
MYKISPILQFFLYWQANFYLMKKGLRHSSIELFLLGDHKPSSEHIVYGSRICWRPGFVVKDVGLRTYCTSCPLNN